MEPEPGSLAEYFDHWYADMTVSPVKDEIQQRHLGLPAPCLGQVQQPVRVPGVATAQAVHAEGQPALGGALFHLPLRVVRLRRAHPVLAGQHVHRGCGHPRRRGGIQLERPVGDRHVAAVGEPRQRLLELPLPEVAPRAHHV